MSERADKAWEIATTPIPTLSERLVALESQNAELVAALEEVRPWVQRRQDDHCYAHGGRSPKLDGLIRTIDAALAAAGHKQGIVGNERY